MADGFATRFFGGSAGQRFKDHVYAVAVSNKHDRLAYNKGPVLERGCLVPYGPLAPRRATRPGSALYVHQAGLVRSPHGWR